MTSRDRSFLRLVGVGAPYVSVLSGLAFLGFGRDAVHTAAIAIGFTVSVFAHLALRGAHTPRAHRPWLMFALVISVAVGAWAAVPAKDTNAKKAPQPQPPGPGPPHRTALALGPGVAIGVHPEAMSAANGKLWMLTGTAVTHFDPQRDSNMPEAFAIDRVRPFDLAVDAEEVVVVAGGFADFYSTRTGLKTRPPLHFSEGPGHVAATEHATWLCNVDHSKVERLDKQTRVLLHIGVPGPPTAIATSATSVWVSTAGGSVVHIDEPTGKVLGSYTTEDGPGPLVLGVGQLWVSHPERRVLTSVDPLTGLEVGDPIQVAADIKAVVTFNGSVWVLSGATDTLQRIDPKSRQKVDELQLPSESSGMAVLDGKLWVISAGAGQLYQVAVPPPAKPTHGATP